MSAKQLVVILSFFLVSVLGLPARADLIDSVVAVWLFDEGSGLTAGDSVGDHDGELIGGVDWTAEAMFGSALEFSGENGSRVEVPHTDDLTLDTWTITAWARLEPPLTGGWAIIVVKDPANGLQNYSLDLNGAGNVFAEVTNGGSWSDAGSAISVYDDEWHFLAASYDGDTLRAYVDGFLEAEQDFGPGDQNDAPLSIGDRLDESQPVLGFIDDIGLFDTALEENDLANLMNNGLKQALGIGGVLLRAGDANQDLQFNQVDLVQVQIAAKYLTGQAATWGEGDWDGAPGGTPGSPPAGNGQFDQLDVIAALSAGTYLTGPYAAINPGGEAGDGQTSIVYNPATGELAVDAPAGTELTSVNIDSAASVLTGDAAQNLGGSFDNDADNNIFKATFGSSFGSLSFGNVAQAGLSEQFLLGDLTVIGSLSGGGDLGEVDLNYVPEPASLLLLGMGFFTILVVVSRFGIVAARI